MLHLQERFRPLLHSYAVRAHLPCGVLDQIFEKRVRARGGLPHVPARDGQMGGAGTFENLGLVIGFIGGKPVFFWRQTIQL
ncbi:MAG: hypothetical protein CMF52_00020 [Legionellales bacterium]|nr:hypothetical protein [Legionellales bacterium]